MMSGKGGSLGIKRKRVGSKDLKDDELAVYELIKNKGDMGIWKGDVKTELKMPNTKLVDNYTKTLMLKGLIKEVADVNAKGKKKLMASEFEPSTDLTGGVWYSEGVFDDELVKKLKEICVTILRQKKVATADGILHEMNRSGVLNCELKREHVKQILDNLCLDRKITREKSTGLGEFVSFPINSECFKLKSGKERVGAMASIPCGVCPRINQCSPEGIISPVTCKYYTEWLDF